MKMRYALGVFCLINIFALLPPLLSAQTREGENFDRVHHTLASLAIPSEVRPLSGISSILVRSGYGAQGTFVLALPLDADFAVDTGLALAQQMQNQSMPLNIIVAFLGSERAAPPTLPHQGLGDLLSLTDVPEHWVLAYMDITGLPEHLFLYHGARGYLAPLDILRPLVSALRSANAAWSLRIRFNEIYKLGLAEGHQALSVAWNQEINGFALTGRDSPDGDSLSPEAMAGLFLDYALALEFPMLKVDRHYFLFSGLGGHLILLEQEITVTLLLIIAGVSLFLFLLYSAKHYARLLFHFRLFFRSIWIFLLLAAFLVVSITAAGLLYSTLFQSLKPLVPFPGGLSVPAHFIGAALTMMLAVLLFFLHSPVFALIRIPKRAQFYSFSSVIFAIMGVLAAAFLDFSLVPALLWAALFTFLAASLTRPKPIVVCVILIPIFAFAALLNIIQTGNVRIAEFFISPKVGSLSSWLVTFQVALFCLPLMLLIKRAVIQSRKFAHRERGKAPKRRPSLKRRLVTVSACITAILVLMFVHIGFV